MKKSRLIIEATKKALSEAKRDVRKILEGWNFVGQHNDTISYNRNLRDRHNRLSQQPQKIDSKADLSQIDPSMKKLYDGQVNQVNNIKNIIGSQTLIPINDAIEIVKKLNAEIDPKYVAGKIRGYIIKFMSTLSDRGIDYGYDDFVENINNPENVMTRCFPNKKWHKTTQLKLCVDGKKDFTTVLRTLNAIKQRSKIGDKLRVAIIASTYKTDNCQEFQNHYNNINDVTERVIFGDNSCSSIVFLVPDNVISERIYTESQMGATEKQITSKVKPKSKKVKQMADLVNNADYKEVVKKPVNRKRTIDDDTPIKDIEPELTQEREPEPEPEITPEKQPIVDTTPEPETATQEPSVTHDNPDVIKTQEPESEIETDDNDLIDQLKLTFNPIRFVRAIGEHIKADKTFKRQRKVIINDDSITVNAESRLTGEGDNRLVIYALKDGISIYTKFYYKNKQDMIKLRSGDVDLSTDEIVGLINIDSDKKLLFAKQGIRSVTGFTTTQVEQFIKDILEEEFTA